jgi:hypothetical protein
MTGATDQVSTTAGYSGTPLVKKLGVAEGTAIVAIDQPDDYLGLVAPLPAGARIATRMPKTPAFVHLFATRRARLASHLARLRGLVAQDAVVWVSWPKRAAGVATDITEDVIRAEALPLGFVDVKVCAVDQTWSGLKLVIRRELRSTAAAGPSRRKNA